MKSSFPILVTLIALALVISLPALGADGSTAADASAMTAPEGVEAIIAQGFDPAPVMTSAACQSAALPQSSNLGDGDFEECFGPYPPLSCQCGFCCESCKCWQGYNLALCGPMSS